MRISARCDYACKAILELSLHWPNKEPLQVNTISKKQNIPIKYLVQILIQLKRMGLVASVRGKTGGYNLLIAPNKIKLGQLMRDVCGPLLPLTESAERNQTVFTVIWADVENAMAKVLDKISFEDIVEKSKGVDILNYQI